MKVIDGKGGILGRIASYAVKEALKGETIAIINCDDVLISGNKKTTEKEFDIKRSRFGHSQKGPKHHRVSQKIVKRALRGMLPEHRFGRGREAFKKIKCYNKIPEEFKDSKKIAFNDRKPIKYAKVKEFTK